MIGTYLAHRMFYDWVPIKIARRWGSTLEQIWTSRFYNNNHKNTSSCSFPIPSMANNKLSILVNTQIMDIVAKTKLTKFNNFQMKSYFILWEYCIRSISRDSTELGSDLQITMPYQSMFTVEVCEVWRTKIDNSIFTEIFG